MPRFTLIVNDLPETDFELALEVCARSRGSIEVVMPPCSHDEIVSPGLTSSGQPVNLQHVRFEWDAKAAGFDVELLRVLHRGEATSLPRAC